MNILDTPLDKYGFPSGTLMIKKNLSDFGNMAGAMTGIPGQSTGILSDIQQWYKENESIMKPKSVQELASETLAYSSPDNNPYQNAINSVGDKLNAFYKKYSLPLLAIILGIVCIAGSIYTYKD